MKRTKTQKLKILGQKKESTPEYRAKNAIQHKIFCKETKTVIFNPEKKKIQISNLENSFEDDEEFIDPLGPPVGFSEAYNENMLESTTRNG
jgi:hypothetical protein